MNKWQPPKAICTDIASVRPALESEVLSGVKHEFDFGDAPLHRGVVRGTVEVCAFLISGADVHARDNC